MEPVSVVMAANFGGVPAVVVGLVLLVGAWGWSESERRRSDRHLVRLLASESAGVRRYAIQSVGDPSRHAGTLLAHRDVGRDPAVLRVLAEHVKTCRWSRSQAPDWLALRLWAFAYAPEDSAAGPARAARRRRRRTTSGEEAGGRSESDRAPVLSAAGLMTDVLVLVGLVYATWIVGTRSGAFTGFPKGYDAYSHFITIRLILHNFPHFLWNYAWYGGFPAYPGSYPPFYSLFVSAGVAASGASITQAMDVATAVMYMVSVAALYGFVRVLGRNRLIAVATAVVVLAAPALWSASIQAGSYPRLCAMAFGDVAIFVAALDARRPTRVHAVVIALLLGVAMGSHPVIGVLVVFQVACVLAVVPQAPFEQRMRRLAMILVAVAGLSAWYYVPYFLHPSSYYLQAAQSALVVGTPAEFRTLLVVPTGGQYVGSSILALPAVLVPLAIAIGAWITVLLWRPRHARGIGFEESQGQPWRERRSRLSQPVAVAVACLVPALLCLAYAFLPHIQGLRLTFDGVFPDQMLSYAVWPLAAAVGVGACGIVSLFPAWGVRQVVGGVMVVLASGCAVVSVPLFAPGALNDAGTVQQALIGATPATKNTLDERIAGTANTATRWGNAVTDTPEERDDFAQGILNIDYQAWIDDALTTPTFPASERGFLVDWYAIKWLYADDGAMANAYQSQPADYKLLEDVSGTGTSTFRVQDPSPVLSATAAPAVLVVGEEENYSLLLRDLSLNDVPSTSMIPVQGSPYIDDYSLAELERFQSVVLYGFSAHSDAAAARLLDAYVRHGGRLLVEVAGDVPVVEQIAALAPRAFPVENWGDLEMEREWNFGVVRGPLTAGVPFSDFGPAMFGSQPWLVEIAEQREPRSKVVLDADGDPLIVQARDGAGTVVMSGMNLPFHAASFNNAAEAAFLEGLIEGSYARPAAPAPPSYRTRFEGADAVEVDVRVGDATGVLFKENDYPDWHATVNGVATPIYPAGPGMMYVPFSGGTPARISIFYRLSPTEYVSTGITLATIVLLALFAIIPEALRGSLIGWLTRRRGRAPAAVPVRGDRRRVRPASR